MHSKIIDSLLALVLSTGLAAAEDLAEKKRTLTGLYVTAEEAGAMLEDEDVLLVDIRSRAEVAFVGLPVRTDKHISFMEMAEAGSYDPDRATYRLEPNPNFVRDFVFFMRDEKAGGGTRVILMCRSGSRSAKVADILARMGYEAVYTMVDGFEGDTSGDGARTVDGWRNAGLDWTYDVAPWQAYGRD